MRTQITTLPPVKALLERLRTRNLLGTRGGSDAETGEDAEDSLDEPSVARSVRWNFILVWFMRMLALIWIAKGLGYWAVILGADSAPTPFEARSTGFQATPSISPSSTWSPPSGCG